MSSRIQGRTNFSKSIPKRYLPNITMKYLRGGRFMYFPSKLFPDKSNFDSIHLLSMTFVCSPDLIQVNSC